jgi:hypothetical protein
MGGRVPVNKRRECPLNYFAGVPLTNLLRPCYVALPRMCGECASADQAPVDINDIMLGRAYDGWHPYPQNKLAQIMLTFDLAARVEGTGW